MGLVSGGDNTSSRKVYDWATIEKCPRLENNSKITFKDEEMEYLDPNLDNTLVVFVRIINARVKRVIIDIDSFVDILYFDTFQKLVLLTNDLTPITSSLTALQLLFRWQGSWATLSPFSRLWACTLRSIMNLAPKRWWLSLWWLTSPRRAMRS